MTNPSRGGEFVTGQAVLGAYRRVCRGAVVAGVGPRQRHGDLLPQRGGERAGTQGLAEPQEAFEYSRGNSEGLIDVRCEADGLLDAFEDLLALGLCLIDFNGLDAWHGLSFQIFGPGGPGAGVRGFQRYVPPAPHQQLYSSVYFGQPKFYEYLEKIRKVGTKYTI